MATSLAAAVRLQPWQHHHHLHQDVMVEMASGVVKVRAFGGHQPRGRVCRAPTTMTTSSRREILTTSAMSNEDHDITDMQETDKVSGEWWKPILTAVHEWSQDKLLGLAELADGSLFFSFGPSDSDSDDASSRPASKTIAASSDTEPTTAAAAAATISIPRRHASSFRKQSPIPASRKKAIELKKAAAPPPQLPPKEEGHNKNNKAPKKEHKARTTASKAPSKAAQPHRPPSAFFKRSPIPKDRVASSKKQTPLANEAPPSEETVVEPAKESPTSPESSTRVKESAKTPKVGSATEAPGKKKVAAASKASVRAAETTVVEELAQQTSIEAPQDGKSLSAVEIEELSTTTETVVEVVVPAASEKENGAVKQDLSSYKLTELRSLAKARGLKGYSKLKKGELVELLAGLDS